MNVREAELEIARILAAVEETTGDWVERVEIIDVDVTKVADERRQLIREVGIRLKPKPGAQWVT